MREKRRKANEGKVLARDDREEMRLNRFIAKAGVCSRREADKLIADGMVKVNGKVTREMGLKVKAGNDKVEYNGKELSPQAKVYILLNKPKNMITTTSDERGRATVLDAIERKTSERVYPVGRLDRNTTGLLLLTNDGKLTKKLTHPSHEVEKLYKATLDKPLSSEHRTELLNGIALDDGEAKADGIDIIDPEDGTVVGITVHIGRNRIVRRMFAHLGYEVMALDRTMLGPLTKKHLPRGKWRELDVREVAWLKML